MPGQALAKDYSKYITNRQWLRSLLLVSFLLFLFVNADLAFRAVDRLTLALPLFLARRHPLPSAVGLAVGLGLGADTGQPELLLYL